MDMAEEQKKYPVVSFRVSPHVRGVVEQLAARLTIKTGRRHTMSDILMLGIARIASDNQADDLTDELAAVSA